MTPIVPSRPSNPQRNSSNISQSSSFRSLFTQPNKQIRPSTPKVHDNHILPVKDFPPQTERRRSSLPDADVPELELEPVSSTTGVDQFTNSNNIGTKQISRDSSLNHKRSHSLRRKPVPSLLVASSSSSSSHNQVLPPDHPFATAHKKHDSGSSSKNTSMSGRTTPVSGRNTPTIANVHSPDRGMGRTPPPPKRIAGQAKTNEEKLVISKKNNRPDTAGTFGGRKSVEAERDNQRPISGLVDKEDALHARMISLSLDRSLPPSPLDMGHNSLDQTPMPFGMVTPKPVLSTVDINTSRSGNPGDSTSSSKRKKQSLAIPGSAPMMTGGGSSGSKSRSKIFPRWDSTEKVKAEPSKNTKITNEEEFSIDRLPSKKALWEAGTCFLRDENGDLKCFGDFFPRLPVDATTIIDDHQSNGKGPSSILSEAMEKSASYAGSISTNATSSRKIVKTVVFFIRHFWCGQCQDYTFASLSLLDPVALERAGIRVIIISNGSWKIIKAYKKLFNCPFPIYVDGPRRLYQLMGMTKMTNDFGPMFKGRATYHQRPVPTQLLHGLGNAFFRMPLANPGTLTQLGGEFILTPGWECEFAHRMTTTSDHMEAPEVLRLAGCTHPTKSDLVELELADSQKSELQRLEREMKEWQEGKTAEIERIRQKKEARRGVAYSPSDQDPDFLMSQTHDEQTAELPLSESISQALNALGDMTITGDDASKSEFDARLQGVLREQEVKEKEKLAAGELMLVRGKGDLEVGMESQIV
ncbi:uncharacterized protein IL334_000454 [Kwoniella shivajii]|uniref:Thioredoxin domain-containing protein n=1 Tax=Kwoniella shivajii TaxID=564305 RepID=A0ABZ1CP84_9TREE|nr:hypothetical protein IL334_000454 [Kwoniella shivajii]